MPAEGKQAAAPPSSVIGKVDPKTMKYQEIINNPSSNEVPFSTVAVQVGKELWVGSARGDRISRYPADGKLTRREVNGVRSRALN